MVISCVSSSGSFLGLRMATVRLAGDRVGVFVEANRRGNTDCETDAVDEAWNASVRAAGIAGWGRRGVVFRYRA